jgi:hypothetical protein
LEGDCEKDGADHHADPEDDVFGEVNGSMRDITPGEFIHIRGTLGDSYKIGPQDASKSNDKAQEGESTSLEAIIPLFPAIEVGIQVLSLHTLHILELHNRLIINYIFKNRISNLQHCFDFIKIDRIYQSLSINSAKPGGLWIAFLLLVSSMMKQARMVSMATL